MGIKKHLSNSSPQGSSHLYGQGVVRVGRQGLSRGAEASVGEHVLGGVVEDVGGRGRTRGCLRRGLLLQGQFQ